MPEKPILPKISPSQKIGKSAERCFVANHPNSWIATGMSQDDFGIDYEVQFEESGDIAGIFRAQLKGTQSPNLNATGEWFPVELSSSTLNYYDRIAEPILLVLADLTVNPDSPKDCPLYYAWIHDELRRINVSDIPAEQKTATLRVPKTNILTSSTDLSERIKSECMLAKVGANLDATLEAKDPALDRAARADQISRLPDAFKDRGASLFEALAAPPDSPWPDPPRGSLTWHLKEALSNFRHGEFESMAASLDQARTMLADAATLEAAEYWFLASNLIRQKGDEDGALQAIRRADEIVPGSPKYATAWAEAEIRARFKLDETKPFQPLDLSDVIEKMDGQDPAIRAMRARLLATGGKFDEALAAAESIEGAEGLAASGIINIMRSDFAATLKVCAAGLELADPPPGAKQLFLVLKARSRFYESIKGAIGRAPSDRMPPSATPDTKIDTLLQAWDEIKEAAAFLKSAGWPPNVEFVADILANTAAMLNREREALDPLVEAAKARPMVSSLQCALEAIASVCGEHGIALAANEKQPATAETMTRRVQLLHFSRQHRDCVDFFEKSLPSLDSSAPGFPDAVAHAILSADEIVRPDLANSWIGLFASVEGGEAHRAMLEYWRANKGNPSRNDAAMADLLARHQSLGRPVALGLRIFHTLDALKPAQAEQCVALARQIEAERLLHLEGELHLATALMTLERWPETLELTEKASQRFDSPALSSVRALALDNVGRLDEAIELFREVANAGYRTEFMLHHFAMALFRRGSLDEAISTVESAFSVDMSDGNKAYWAGLLYNLVTDRNPNDPRRAELLWKYGAINDQEDERSEAAFLKMGRSAGHLDNSPAAIERSAEFGRRISAFVSRFPRSKLFGAIPIRRDHVIEDLMAAMKEDEAEGGVAHLQFNGLRSMIRTRQVSIPFAYRPKVFLDGISDLAELWDACKASPGGEKELYLQIESPQWRAVPLAAMMERVPLMDLTALMVGYEMKILGAVFETFPKIAIGEAAMEEIRRLAKPSADRPAREPWSRLMSFLDSRSGQLLHPQLDRDSHEVLHPDFWPSDETMHLSRQDGYILYSDDLVFRTECARGHQGFRGMCAMDFIHALALSNHIARSKFIEKLGTLAKWNVLVEHMAGSHIR